MGLTRLGGATFVRNPSDTANLFDGINPGSVSQTKLSGVDDILRVFTPMPDRFMDASGNLLKTKFASFNAAASSTTTLVAAVTGQRISVHGYKVDYGGANGAITMQDDAGSPLVLDRWVAEAARKVDSAAATGTLYQTGVGQALNLVTPATVTAVGRLAYTDGTLAP